MEPVILAAIITAVATLGAAPLIAQRDVIVDTLRLRYRKVSGLWSGRAVYSATPHEVHEFTCRLRQRGGKINGTLTTDDLTDYEVIGHFFETEYFQIAIVNANTEAINYGIGIMRFERSGDEIRGPFLGRTRSADKIVEGTIELRRA